MDKNLDLKSFVDRLIGEKKLPENLEKEVIEEIKKDLLTRVEERINAVIINNLSEEQLTRSSRRNAWFRKPKCPNSNSTRTYSWLA